MERLFSRAILAKLSPFLIRTHSVGGVGLVWAMGERVVLAGVGGVGAEVGGGEEGAGLEGRRRMSPAWRRWGLMPGLALVKASTEVDWLFAI